VPLDEPGWWYRAEPTLLARVLRPAARVYGAATARRLAQPHDYRSPLPVICVGNFTAGGTGKTPLALHIAERLAFTGERPAFLTRGYGGRSRSAEYADPTRQTSSDIGDEPLLLARAAPTMVSADRAAGARAIEALRPPPTVIVMDDGLQNPALAKTLAIGVVDARRGFGNGEVIPAGPLRAPLEAQLPHVHAIVVMHAVGTAIEPEQGVLGWLRRRFQGPVLTARTEVSGPEPAWAGKPVIAFAGIANPDRFFVSLARAGAEITERHAFSDHHDYTETDAARLLARAEKLGAQLVTTAKDHVRLLNRTGRRAELAERARVLAIRAHFEPSETERLDALLAAACRPDQPR
jgi:tetraacyldisaccharide 4'-kinase